MKPCFIFLELKISKSTRLDVMTFFQTIMQLLSFGYVGKSRLARADDDRDTPGKALMVTPTFRRASPEVLALRELFMRVSPRTTSNTCSICLNTFRRSKFVFKLSCQHLFHSGCIEQWSVIGARTCPVCRHPFTLPFAILEE